MTAKSQIIVAIRAFEGNPHDRKKKRMQDNFLSGRESASINVMLAATGWNLKKMMKDLINYRLLEKAVVKDRLVI